ncbi:hypothetical protein A8C46_00310 [Ligilactobacillus salivarius]|nr:hypothetical protein A8C38_00330 [Ligilactobacillus salivarius]PAY43594.1 hypothetical protein A8C39_00510 [Ligilactobacillus salivarius]PAY53213.1 hypothetical protein A8C41_08550 [Ligilactobacillus salivarius]PAY58046.1 hypothetical protein A8C46_00310 [Ligilactobacillus salivarius]PAY58644.1 hypothetical protein A8C40_00815 [Ligilactobacillus salivarius]
MKIKGVISIIGKIIDGILLGLLTLAYLVLLACVIYFFPHAIHVCLGVGWLILYWLFFGIQTTIGLVVVLLIIIDSLGD